jgi:hypothetical protein
MEAFVDLNTSTAIYDNFFLNDLRLVVKEKEGRVRVSLPQTRVNLAIAERVDEKTVRVKGLKQVIELTHEAPPKRTIEWGGNAVGYAGAEGRYIILSPTKNKKVFAEVGLYEAVTDVGVVLSAVAYASSSAISMVSRQRGDSILILEEMFHDTTVTFRKYMDRTFQFAAAHNLTVQVIGKVDNIKIKSPTEHFRWINLPITGFKYKDRVLWGKWYQIIDDLR